MRLPVVAVIAATLLLAGCSAPAPQPAQTDDGKVPSIAGDWVLSRTVTSTEEGSGYAVGDSEKRYLEIADDGTLVTSEDDSVFDGGDGTTLDYTWDGTAFSYEQAPITFDCRGADDTVLLADAYTVTFDTGLTAVDATPSGFTGTMTIDIEPKDDDAAAKIQTLGCPHGGSTDFDVTLDPG